MLGPVGGNDWTTRSLKRVFQDGSAAEDRTAARVLPDIQAGPFCSGTMYRHVKREYWMKCEDKPPVFYVLS